MSKNIFIFSVTRDTAVALAATTVNISSLKNVKASIVAAF